MPNSLCSYSKTEHSSKYTHAFPHFKQLIILLLHQVGCPTWQTSLDLNVLKSDEKIDAQINIVFFVTECSYKLYNSYLGHLGNYIVCFLKIGLIIIL